LSRVTEIDSDTLTSDRDGVRWETTVASCESSEDFTRQLTHRELTESRNLDAVGVCHRERSDLTLLLTGPALADTGEPSALKLVLLGRDDLSVDEDELHRQDRTRVEMNTATFPREQT
jgi:hypothetical protein